MNDELKDNQNLEPEEEVSDLQKIEKQANEYLNGWKRAQADFANFKKDEEKRVEAVLKFGNEALLLEALNEVDNLEAALNHVPEDVTEKHKDWANGLKQVRDGFQSMLSRHGIEKIKTQGEKFDPLFHEAIGPGGEDIKEEIRAGYILNGKVIRPARVKI